MQSVPPRTVFAVQIPVVGVSCHPVARPQKVLEEKAYSGLHGLVHHVEAQVHDVVIGDVERQPLP